MAFPTTSVIEDFAAKGTDWTDIYNVLTFTGGKGTSNTLDDWSLSLWDTSTFGADSEAYCTVPGVSSDYHGLSLFVRCTTLSESTFDGYGLNIDIHPNPDTWTIEEVLNGGTTSIGSGTSNLANGDKVGLEVIGSTLKAYKYTSGAWNSTAIVSVSDTTYGSAGYIGIGVKDNNFYVDDFGGGTVVTASGRSTRNTRACPLGIYHGMNYGTQGNHP